MDQGAFIQLVHTYLHVHVHVRRSCSAKPVVKAGSQYDAGRCVMSHDKWEDFVLSQPRLAGSKNATLAMQE